MEAAIKWIASYHSIQQLIVALNLLMNVTR